MQNSIQSWKKMAFRKKSETMLLMVHLPFFYEKQLLLELFFENQQTYANLLLELTLAKHTPTQWINPCRSVVIRDGISILRRVDLHLERTSLAAVNVFSCSIFNELDQNVKLKASVQQADRKKDCCSVDWFCSLCNTVFEALGCF